MHVGSCIAMIDKDFDAVIVDKKCGDRSAARCFNALYDLPRRLAATKSVILP
jgi:hypothetical protein